jgi:hypothetical protein
MKWDDIAPMPSTVEEFADATSDLHRVPEDDTGAHVFRLSKKHQSKPAPKLPRKAVQP